MIFDLFRKIGNKIVPELPEDEEVYHEYCPRCQADIVMQKGFNNDLPYWICKGCGEMLINRELETDTDILWRCDECESVLNIQEGFSEDCGEWSCRECGFVNRIDMSEVYRTVDEYEADRDNPYKGLSDEAVLELSGYDELASIGEHENVLLVRSMEDGVLYVKKILGTYDATVYEYLMKHPIDGMPRIMDVYEGENSLVVIEEYIEGATLAEIIDQGSLDQSRAIEIAMELCRTLAKLHSVDPPIIHRDIKPSNVIISGDGTVYLLDINVAKWFNSKEAEDTRLLGTLYYAAPEQLGYGFTASSEKTDIYAFGILLNVMITGKLPKEKKASGAVWEIVKRCICLNAEERYCDEELMAALENVHL